MTPTPGGSPQQVTQSFRISEHSLAACHSESRHYIVLGWKDEDHHYGIIGVWMSPHRICEKLQQKIPKFPQKSLFKITDSP